MNGPHSAGVLGHMMLPLRPITLNVILGRVGIAWTAISTSLGPGQTAYQLSRRRVFPNRIFFSQMHVALRVSPLASGWQNSASFWKRIRRKDEPANEANRNALDGP